MAKGKPTQFLIAHTTVPKPVTITIDSDEAHENEIANYIRIAKQQGQTITRSIFLKHAEQHILKNDRLYKQLAGKIKPRKKLESTHAAKPQPTEEIKATPSSTTPQASLPTLRPTSQQPASTTNATQSAPTTQSSTAATHSATRNVTSQPSANASPTSSLPILASEAELSKQLGERKYIHPTTGASMNWIDMNQEQKHALTRAEQSRTNQAQQY